MSEDAASQRFLLVIPCFREAARLQAFLSRLCPRLADLPGEILVVEDGSGPAASAITRAIVERQRDRSVNLLPMLALENNRGKGGAVYEGWSRHNGAEWLAFVDADGASPAVEVRRLLLLALGKPDHTTAIFASRIRMLGKTIRRSLSRHLTGRIFVTLVSNLLRVNAYDTQCGLKVVPRLTFETVLPVLYTRNFAFDVELTVALLDAGFAIEEVPIDWHDVPGSRVSLVRDSWRMFRELWAIKKRRSGWNFNAKRRAA